MPEIHYIKHLRETDDLSISEISRKVGKNWRKSADGDVYPSDFDINFTKTGMMYDSEFGEIVDLWLEEDSKLRRKERRTNKKIFNQLKQNTILKVRIEPYVSTFSFENHK